MNYIYHRLFRILPSLPRIAITAAIFVIQPNAVADILRELHNRIGAYPAEVAVVSSLLVGHLDPIV